MVVIDPSSAPLRASVAPDAAAGGAAPAVQSPGDSGRRLLQRIVRGYDDRVVRWYCRGRFLILRLDILDEVGQYMPEAGRILDIGCGFGLFGLYFAGLGPQRQIIGYDLNDARIAMGLRAARCAGIHNADFRHGNALTLSLDGEFDGIYALDLIHHLPRASVPGFLAGLHRVLRAPGIMVIKDVADRPVHKRWFTLALDRLMVGWREPIHYWPIGELRELLRHTGFQVYAHTIRDILPYPHVLYICHK